tara:strand:- start:74 stop:478 length:405 start_codon:yes stop_codon:yes gene_type:complete
MLKTNSKKFKLNFRNEILANINDDVENLSDIDKLKYLAETIEKQINYAYNLKRYPNTQQRLANYLSGLAFGFCEGYSHKMIEQAERLIEGKFPENKKDKIIENYYSFIALHLMKLINKELNISFHINTPYYAIK